MLSFKHARCAIRSKEKKHGLKVKVYYLCLVH